MVKCLWLLDMSGKDAKTISGFIEVMEIGIFLLLHKSNW